MWVLQARAQRLLRSLPPRHGYVLGLVLVLALHRSCVLPRALLRVSPHVSQHWRGAWRIWWRARG
jgi:hypothetical protein